MRDRQHQITSVASSLFGVSGRSMLASLMRGNRDAGWMADYARGRLRGKKFQLELALQGTFTDHQRGVLSRLMRQVQFRDECVQELTAEIEKRMMPYEDLVQRLDGIPGIDRVTVWTVLAEIGTDMSVFGDARHLASWAALCPGNRESGGKRMSGKQNKPKVTRKLVERLQRFGILRHLASSAAL